MRLDSKVALITGAASGIGLATAQLFARVGAQLALLDRDVDGLRASARMVACSVPPVLLPGDVADRQAVADAVREALDHFDRIDVLINHAAIVADWGLAAEVPDAVWDEILAINLRGIVNMCRVVVPSMQQGAAIINTSSICGTVPACATRAPYDVAKAGVVAFTRDLAVAYGSRGIRANVVVPGFIDTPMSRRLVDGHEERARAEETRIPLRRIGLAEEVARASLFLASDAASYITGSMLFVDGGLSLV